MANQLEDDVQRVLELARSRSLSCRARARNETKRLDSHGSTSRARHRHVEQGTLSRPTLVAARMKGLAAIYSLDKTSRHLADCSANSILRYQMNASDNNKESESDPTVARRKLDARRELYKLHYSGSGLATATCASTGLPKLESLVEAAQQAVQMASHHLAVRVGAAVLTSRHRILSACAVESLSNDKYSVCAEHAAILKMLTTTTSTEYEEQFRDDTEVVEAIAICSDRQDDALPFPCGGCREYMAGFGDFPVYLVNFGGSSDETRSFDLFPGARHAEITRITRQAVASDSQAPQQQRRHGQSRINSATQAVGEPLVTTNELPMDVTEWTIEHVARWVVDDVELPQYRDVFLRNKVDGCVLSHLEDCDLQLLLGITHPLHRRRVLVHLDRLRDRELLTHGIDYGQLQDYLAVLDRDRIAVVARLKAAFDRLDADKDGFLDFAQVHAALKSLRNGVASPQAVERLLHNENLFGSDAKDGKVTFPAFATAFSSLAMQPASEKRGAGLAGRSNDEPKTTQMDARLPLVDLQGLRGSFDKVDTNKSGLIDEKELVQLFQSLGHDAQTASGKASEWFKAADMDGDARLSFAEFLLRYVQLSKIDVRKLRTLFDTSEPLSSTRLKPRTVVRRSLSALFPEIDRLEIDAWAEKFFAVDTTGNHSESLTVTFADFVLACLSFNVEVAGRQTLGVSSEMARSLRNDSLAHRSRIVHLQQQGHVRLCPQGRELRKIRREHVEAQQRQLERMRKQQQDRKLGCRVGSMETERDGKCADSEDEEAVQPSAKNVREREVNDTFDRFGSRSHKQRAATETKCNDSDEEQDARRGGALTIVEAAQAALELGAALSREQVVRFLQSFGFDLRHPLTRRDFHRVMAHLDAKERVSSAPPDAWRVESGKNTPKVAKREVCGQKRSADVRQQGVNRQEYERHLLAQHHKGKTQIDLKETRKLLAGRPSWSQEMRRAVKGDRSRSQRPRRKDVEESKGDSSDSSSGQSRPSRRCKANRHRRCDRDDSDRENSSSSGRQRHRRASRSRSKRSVSKCHHRRRRHRSDSSSSDSTDSTASSPRSRRSATNFLASHQRHSGFSEGDRVRHKPSDALGSVLRVYRDYFVADVLFDSGRHLKNVDLASLQRIPTPTSRPEDQWKRGLAVLVPYKPGLKAGRALRRGKILKCRTDGTCDVLVDEFGESETLTRVPGTLLRLARRKQPAFYGVGAKVTVRQRSEYLRGTVAVCRTDGSYDVRLRGSSRVLFKVATELLSLDDDEDYDEEENHDGSAFSSSSGKAKDCSDSEVDGPKRTRKVESDSDGDKRASSSRGASKKREEEDNTYDDFEPEFGMGDRVQARFNGGSAFFPGKITRAYADDTFDVAYDDGDEETRVPGRLIRSAATKAAAASSAKASGVKATKRDDYDDDLFESD